MKPKKRIRLDHSKPDFVSNNDDAMFGYNQACSEWQEWITQELKSLLVRKVPDNKTFEDRVKDLITKVGGE